MPAADKRRKGRHAGSVKGLPGWAMLTIGLVIGLFIAFLVYLDDLDPEAGEGPPVATDDDTSNSDDSKRPRFEFYSILPELEVVLPEFRRRDADDVPPTEAPTEAPAEDLAPPTQPLDPLPETDAEGRFFLQVGSFREADQAESMKAEVILLGLDAAIRTVEVNGKEWHRVRSGPFTDPERLRSAQDRLRASGIDYLVLRDRQ